MWFLFSGANFSNEPVKTHKHTHTLDSSGTIRCAIAVDRHIAAPRRSEKATAATSRHSECAACLRCIAYFSSAAGAPTAEDDGSKAFRTVPRSATIGWAMVRAHINEGLSLLSARAHIFLRVCAFAWGRGDL